MAKKLTVVLSQGQSRNPAKRNLEEEIVAQLLFEPNIDVTIIPHLYDLKADGSGMLCLQGISGDFVVLAWLFDRAARWTLDRNNVGGKVGTTLLTHEEDDDELEDELEDEPAADEKDRVQDFREIPNRLIYCIDLRVSNSPEPYVDEVKRIAKELSSEVVQLGNWLQGSPTPEQAERFANPTNDTAVGNVAPTNGTSQNGHTPEAPEAIDVIRLDQPNEPTRIEDEGTRRWYPVIDFSRCTNCMECIDFCLFGVYGVDGVETILVEQPDNCRKGCPACSRVCPENAIIFPQHKTPTIAGSPEVASGGLKIDLSQLFGKPQEEGDSVDTAVRERDEQLLLAGRESVGKEIGLSKRQTEKANEPKDDLDALIDAVDDLDL
ncbi:MAG: ATP-binding protein [Pirellulales bacterium]